jgi:arylsulfatase A-like enzyme
MIARCRIAYVLSAIVLFCLPTALLKAAESARPNILFIYTDDQSSRTVSCYDEAYDWVKTPNIDSLAKSGVRFSHAYIGSWCMPSRATMLTGHHQHGVESMRMEGEYPGSAYDPKLCPFWPSVFREQGYFTAHIGKWHTGVDAGYGRDWDFQKVWNRPRYPKNAPNYYYDQWINSNGGPAKEVKGYTTDNYTDWAVDFIGGNGRDKDKPWYLWLCYGAVHGPFTPAKRHLDDYEKIEVPAPKDVYPPRKGKPEYSRKMEFWEEKNGVPVERKVRDIVPVGMKDLPGRPLKDWVRQYNQGVLAIDEGVGRVLKALQESGQDENTFVVFTSDQGFGWGQHGFKSKVAPYHATIAAPLIIRPPTAVAKKVAGKVVREPVSGVDIPPTLFAQAGLKLPWKMHGYDLSPLLTDRNSKWNHPAMVVHTAKSYGSKTHKVPKKDDPKLYHGPGVPWYVMIAEGRYKYIRTLVEGEVEELYDLRADPDELTNLAIDKKYKQQLEKYRAAAIKELERTDAEFRKDLPNVGT